MATLYKRGPSYYLNWHDKDGQHRQSLGKIPKKEAELRRKAKEVELGTGKNIFAPSELFGDVAVDYLDEHKVDFPDSHDRVDFIIEKRLTQFHDKPLNEITKRDVERWKAARLKQVSPGTVTKELRTLKALFNYAIKNGDLDKSPALSVTPPKRTTDERMVWYTAAQLAELYKADKVYAPVWQLMANTGLRRTEAQQLKWPDRDWETAL